MPHVVFYFQLHQPFLLHPERDKFFWEEKNREIFLEVADKCYLPALRILTGLVAGERAFKLALGMSGTFLKQAELYNPEVIRAMQRLLDTGREKGQIECLDETYFHSYTSLFADPRKQEFRDQVSMHRDKLRDLFGVFPTSFCNTDLFYNSQIATVVSDMGYQAMLCEDYSEAFRGHDSSQAPLEIYRIPGSQLVVLPRSRKLSRAAASFHPPELSPQDYAATLARAAEKVILLGFNIEHMGRFRAREKGNAPFWRDLPSALTTFPDIMVATPAEIAHTFRDAALLEAGGADPQHVPDTLETVTQRELFSDIERLEGEARRAGGELLNHWRHLTTSDHLSLLREKARPHYLNPYDSLIRPAQVLTRKIDYLEMALKRFSIMIKKEKTAVLVISPETGRLPEGMGGLAKYISGKTGGQGEVVSALCEGLTERGIDVHLITLNLKRRFREEAKLTEQQWRQVRYSIDPQNIHLVSSSLFAEKLSAYAGNALLTAAEFQKEVVNNIIKMVRARHTGLIIHSHDWMAGGAITAYAKARALPVLHTVHNVFTADLPLDYLAGVDRQSLSDYLYLTGGNGADGIDCQATAIKDATIINFVGQRFLMEVVDDYFLDRNIVPPSVRKEVKAKYYAGAAWSIINAPSSSMYPERCGCLAKNYGPDDEVLAAKKENLSAFQQRSGLEPNPEAILFYWPSRLDPVQKGVELLEKIALPFVMNHRGVQMAIVADGIGADTSHRDALVNIALASQGRITYQPFSEELSLLGYAAANDVFGASLYEPCGQIDQLGNIFGATATNRDTGGYHDKIRELRIKSDGAPQDVGNGFLFRDYDVGGLRYALEKSLLFHRRLPQIREGQIIRIMKEAREEYDLGKMIAAYIRIYEKLNGNKPLD